MENLSIPGFSLYGNFSRSFQSFIHEVGAAKTKYEVDLIVQKRLSKLRKTIIRPDLTTKQMKEHLIELIYCEMLGQDALFGQIHAVKFVEQNSMNEKRVGYAACCLLLDASDELTLLLISTLQKDLKRSNILEVSSALMAVTHLVNKEMIPAILPCVIPLLDNSKELIRKKAVMALIQFHTIDPTSVSEHIQRLSIMLCDKDISVMGAVLNFYIKVVKVSADDCKVLTSSFVKIMDQMNRNKIPNDYIVNGIAAPWIRIKLLKVLAMLGANDRTESEKMFSVLAGCLESCQSNCTIGCAVVYECISTIATIYPMTTLVESAEKYVGTFLTSRNNNIKYLGITALSHLIQINPAFAIKHQMTVIDCLNDPDETLKRKTLDLLCKMTNSTNVKVICEKFLNHLRLTIDPFLRESLVTKLTDLAYKYSPDHEWFVDVMIDICEVGGSVVKETVAFSVMQLLSEDSDDSKNNESQLRDYAVKRYLEIIGKRRMPDILTIIMVWVIGECASVCVPPNRMRDVVDKLIALIRNPMFANVKTLPWIVSALTKIIGKCSEFSDSANSVLIEIYSKSMDVDVQQRCSEAIAFRHINPTQLSELFPGAGCNEDIEISPTLDFLDDYVSSHSDVRFCDADPHQSFMKSKTDVSEVHLKFEAYTTPSKDNGFIQSSEFHADDNYSLQETKTIGQASNEYVDMVTNDNNYSSVDMVPANQDAADPNTKQMWGPTGYASFDAKQAEPETTNMTCATPSLISNCDKGNTPRDDSASIKETPPMSLEEQKKNELASALFSGLSTQHKEETQSVTSSILNKNDDEYLQPEGKQHDNISSIFDDHNVHITNDNTVYEGSIDQLIKPEQEDIKAAQSASNSDLLLLDTSSSSLIEPSTNTYHAASYDTALITHDLLSDDILDNSVITAADKPCSLPSYMITYEHSDHPVTVISDVNIRMSLQLVYNSNKTIAVVFIRTTGNSSLNNIDLIVQPPSNIKAMLTNSDALDDSVALKQGRQSMSDIDITMYDCLYMHLIPQSPALHMVIEGELHYKDRTATFHRLFWKHRVLCLDFLRATTLTTKDIEQLWPRYSCSEKFKVELKTPITIQMIVDCITAKEHFQCVQIIDNEAIFAAQDLDASKVFLHLKHRRSTTELWVKSDSKLQSQAVLNNIKSMIMDLE